MSKGFSKYQSMSAEQINLLLPENSCYTYLKFEGLNNGIVKGRFICKCGIEKITDLGQVISGGILSCGCLSRQIGRKHLLKHIESLEGEIWKPIVGYDGYEVSNKGRIKSFSRTHKLLKLVDNNKGYLMARLCKNNKKKAYSVHRLVAIAFIPNPKKLPKVNHKDCNKKNNIDSNLEWCTQAENVQHSVKSGLIAKGQYTTGAKITNAQAQEIRGIYARGGITQTQLGKQYNIHNSSISLIVNNKTYCEDRKQ